MISEQGFFIGENSRNSCLIDRLFFSLFCLKIKLDSKIYIKPTGWWALPWRPYDCEFDFAYQLFAARSPEVAHVTEPLNSIWISIRATYLLGKSEGVFQLVSIGYDAKESILHPLWEMDTWLKKKYMKNTNPIGH